MPRTFSISLLASMVLSQLLLLAWAWQSIRLLPEVGGGIVSVSGFEVLSASGPLLGLQVIAILLYIYLNPLAIRVVSGTLALALMAQLWFGVSEGEAETTRFVEIKVSTETGIAGIAQMQAIESIQNSFGLLGYLAFIGLSIVLYGFVCILGIRGRNRQGKHSLSDDSLSLWDEQRPN